MNWIKNHKKTAIVVPILIILLVAVLFTQVFSPLSYSFDEAAMYIFGGDGSSPEDEYVGALNGSVTDVQLLSDKNYDFSNLEDYAQIVLWYDVSNHSVFDINNVEFSVLDIQSDYDGLFLCKLDAVVTVIIDRLDSDNVRLDLYMYINDMTEEEIIEAIKGLTVEIQYQHELFGSGTMAVAIPDDLSFSRVKYY